MLGYLDNPEATAESLRTHDDGREWLHTGDIGKMDEEGFFYFASRLKRMIRSSGFNVFPAQASRTEPRHKTTPISPTPACRVCGNEA
jgi:long-chain acyl-CoA synthetase